jgi:ATP-dependent DNA helicase RecG
MASLAELTRTPVTRVHGIGEVTARILEKGGIVSVADLFQHFPHRYEESAGASIANAPQGGEVTLIGQVRSVRDRRPRRNLLIIEMVLADDSGSLTAIWFNQRHLTATRVGTYMMVSGVVERYRGQLQMRVKRTQVLGETAETLLDRQVYPVHSVVGDITAGKIEGWIRKALNEWRPIEDPVPVEFLAARGLAGRDQAFLDIHFPGAMEATESARRRLVYDELFRLELALALQKRRRIAEAVGIAHDPDGELVAQFIAGLPYTLTNSQVDALDEIRGDLRSATPMHRLLHGEVGSGKTVVAVAALLDVIETGAQGAVMAPTEVLAEQHFLSIGRLLSEAGLAPEMTWGGERFGVDSLFTVVEGPVVRVGLLTGSVAAANYEPAIRRAELLADIAAGRVDLLVGTHALIQDGVGFSRLGMAVVDEQHRFGVAQRIQIKEKAEVEPDLLIMTATPIPRTLSMTLYGDLDVSGIGEMPPGRTVVATRHLSRSQEPIAWDAIRAEVAAGRQAFVVCPLVEDSDKVEAASAKAEHERLSAIFPDLEVGLLHGQMRPGEKEEVMSAVRSGDLQVLVATTVIEVGIDIPNATVMVIEDADRFGLSQLHQLRGRVGRGGHRSMCFLIADPGTEEAEQRIAAMVSTNDGMELAKADLALRGQGTVFGVRQSGIADLRLASIIDDLETLVEARRDAFSLVQADENLAGHADLVDEIKAMLGERVEWLFRS